MSDAPPRPTEPRDAGTSAGHAPADLPDDDDSRWFYGLVPFKLGEGATGPLVPLYAATFVGATASRIGVMEATFSALGVLGAFAWGRTSDDVEKRKPFIVLGFVGLALSFIGMGLANGFWPLFAARALMGFALAAIIAVGGALVADQASQANIGQRIGKLNSVGGYAYVAGLAGGAVALAWITLEDVFLVAGAASLVSAGLVLFLVHEPASHLRRGDIHRLFRNVSIPFSMPANRRLFTPTLFLHRPKLSDVQRRAWAYLAAIFLAFTGATAGFVLFPLYLVGLGLTPAWVLTIMLLNAGLCAVLYKPAGALADRVGYRKVQLGAIGTRSFMFVLIALPAAQNVASAVVFIVLAAVSWAVLHTTGPAALVRNMAIRRRGELMGLYNIAAGLGGLVGALVGGFGAQHLGFPALFLVSSGLIAVALVVTAQAVYPRHLGRH